MYTTQGFQPQSLGVLPTGKPAYSTRENIIASVQQQVARTNVIQGVPTNASIPARQWPAFFQRIIAFAQARRAQEKQTDLTAVGQVRALISPVVQSGVGGLQIPFPLPNGVHSGN